MIIKALLPGGVAITLGNPPIQRTYRIYSMNGTKRIPDDEANAQRDLIDFAVSEGKIEIVEDTPEERLGTLVPGGSLSYLCTSSEEVGDLVYISGANTVARADAADANKVDVVGHIVSKPSSTTCLVSNGPGPVDGSGLTASHRVFLSATTPGAVVSTTPPASPALVVEVGVAVSATQWIYLGAKIVA